MSDHRLTPDSVLEAVRRMGPIGTDPCSNRWSRVFAAIEYDDLLRGDGLALPWNGLTFINGPWSNLLPWAREVAGRHGKPGLEILWWSPCYTETKWAKALWSIKPSVCFWGKRVQHIDPAPDWDEKRGRWKSNDNTMWPTMMVYSGHRHDLFLEVFSAHGVVMRVESPQR